MAFHHSTGSHSSSQSSPSVLSSCISLKKKLFVLLNPTAIMSIPRHFEEVAGRVSQTKLLSLYMCWTGAVKKMRNSVLQNQLNCILRVSQDVQLILCLTDQVEPFERGVWAWIWIVYEPLNNGLFERRWKIITQTPLIAAAVTPTHRWQCRQFICGMLKHTTKWM